MAVLKEIHGILREVLKGVSETILGEFLREISMEKYTEIHGRLASSIQGEVF